MRRIAIRTLFVVLAAVCLLLPQPLAAQEDTAEPLLWLSYVTAEPGKSNELGMHLAGEGAKIYDGLIADGHVLSWGVAQAVNHYPDDDWTHVEFINFRDWAAVGEFVNRFMGGMQAMTEEEQAANAAKWAELTVHGSHYDAIGRHKHLASAGGRPSYISLSSFQTKPGSGPDDVAVLYREWRAPVMDEVMEGGKITSHGFYVSEMHDPAGWDDVTAWYAMPDLGGIDAVRAAGDAAEAKRSEEEKAAWGEAMEETFEYPDQGTHSDRLLVVLHFNSASLAEMAEE